MTDRVNASTTARAVGFVSAVLLVVLLSTTGWPSESSQLIDHVHVTSSESGNCEAVGASCRKQILLRPAQADIRVVLPRVVPWQRRVDSWGLPPPRAPAA